MEKLIKQEFVGERALYNKHNLMIEESLFHDGESPLKECSNIEVKNSTFSWKYPMWYSKDINVYNSVLDINARSGIWYTSNISIIDSIIDAPKTFRRSENITVLNSNFNNAQETLWTCKNVKITNSYAKGDYFLMNSSDIELNNFKIDGNYIFDGAKNIVVKDSYLNSKDSFWNTKNVKVYNTTIIGEYIGWNSENMYFENCTIDSIQAFCYIKGLTLKNCILKNTNLSFEFVENIDAKILSEIESVKNPISGKIEAYKINELILDEELIDKSKTIIKETKNV